MRLTKTLSLTPLAALLAAAGLLGAALPARATAVVDGLNAEVLVSAAGGAYVSDGPDNTPPDVLAAASSSSDISYGYSRAFGMTSGPYAVQSYGAGVFDAQALFTRTWDITNDTATAQQYSFSFYVYGGDIGTYSYGAPGTGWSSYLIDIDLGGTQLFSSGARINSDGSYTETGTQLNDAQAYTTTGNALYAWIGTTVTLDLGVFNPGESRLLSYDMVSHSFGDYGTVERCDEGYGVATYALVEDVPVAGYGTYCYTTTGGSGSFTGDPSELSSTPVLSPTITARAANDVPEPGTLALLGLGLTAALGLRPRRRRD